VLHSCSRLNPISHSLQILILNVADVVALRSAWPHSDFHLPAGSLSARQRGRGEQLRQHNKKTRHDTSASWAA